MTSLAAPTTTSLLSPASRRDKTLGDCDCKGRSDDDDDDDGDDGDDDGDGEHGSDGASDGDDENDDDDDDVGGTLSSR